MDPSVIASIALLGSFVAYPILSSIAARWLPTPSSLAFTFRKWILNPQVPRNFKGKNLRGETKKFNVLGRNVITPLYVFAMMILLALNVAALTVNIKKSREILIRRSGRVLAFNLGLLCASGRQTMLSDSFGIPLEFQGFFHRWLGRTVFLEAVVHFVASLIRGGSKLAPVSKVAAFIAAAAFLGLVIFSLPIIRRIAYEIFCNVHVLLAVVLVVATFLHLEPIGISKPSAILLVITGSFYTVIIGMRMGVLILQKADATIRQGDGLLKVELELRRPLKVCAGQQIWLRIPYTSYTAFAESHPFVVSSWEKAENGMAKKIILLIEPKKGFTGRLKILATSEFIDPPRFTALIEGPYGRPTRAEDFGTVILYATGIGIAAQLAVVKQVLESRESGHAKTQRITLLWEVEKELVYQDEKGKLKYDTASQMVIDLLNQDYLRLKNSMNQDWLDFIAKLTPEEAKEALKFKSVWKGADPDQGYVFRCTKYIKNSSTSEQTVQKHGDSACLNTDPNGLDPVASLESELSKDISKGDTFISVCAYPEMADSIRNYVANKGLHLHEHAFRPGKWPKLNPRREEDIIGYEDNKA